MIGIGMGLSLGSANKGYVRRNLLDASGNISNAAWTKAGTASATGNVANFPTATDAIFQSIGTPAGIGDSATASAELSGSGTTTLRVQRLAPDGAFEFTETVVTLTGTPTWYYVTHTMVNPDQNGFTARVVRANAGQSTTVTVTRAQFERGTVATAYQPRP